MPADQPSPNLPVPADEERHPILEEHGYHIIKMLGKGSYAVVRLAYSDHHQTNVAVKVISKRDAPSEFLEKFLPREITIVKMLKHPHLVVFLQAGHFNISNHVTIITFIIVSIIRICSTKSKRQEGGRGFWY